MKQLRAGVTHVQILFATAVNVLFDEKWDKIPVRTDMTSKNHSTQALSETEFREVEVHTGVRLRYAAAGAENGNPVILLHGYSDSSFSFSPIVPLLPPDLRLVIPDQRGHGESERPFQGYAPAELASDALALLDVLGIPNATVIGHSLGGFVAQWMAVLAPERVSRLVLVSTASEANTETVRSLAPAIQALTDPVDISFIRDFQSSTIHRSVPEAFFDRVITESQKLPARVWRAILGGLLTMPPLHNAVSPSCPTGVLWGDQDAIFSRSDQEKLVRRISGSRLQVLPDMGHAPHWEAPQEFVAHLMTSLAN